LKFPPELREDFLAEVRAHPDAHHRFPADVYRRDDGRILVYIDGLAIFLHRWAYRKLVGPLTRRMFLLPDCVDRKCQNPYHWKPSRSSIIPREGSKPRPPAGGMSAPEINATKTHCPQGHEYTPENTYLWVDKKGNTHRKCKRCTIRRAVKQRQNERGSNG